MKKIVSLFTFIGKFLDYVDETFYNRNQPVADYFAAALSRGESPKRAMRQAKIFNVVCKATYITGLVFLGLLGYIFIFLMALMG